MRKLLLIYIVLLGFSSFSLKGQDIHFSQPTGVPPILNPAYTGFFNGQYRIGAIYRNQWASVISPYQTYGLSAEAILLQRSRVGDALSAGINFVQDIAGTSRYGNFQGNISVAYRRPINRANTQFLSLGLQGGFGQYGFSTNKLVFGRDPESNESFSSSYDQYLDFSAGLVWQYQSSEELLWEAGVGTFHLTQPAIEYSMYNSSTQVPIRYLAHVNVNIRYWDNFGLVPSVMYQMQKNFQEIVYGGDFKWYINEVSERYLTLSAGLYFRQSDAIILGLKSEYKTWLFCLGYDTNISSLRKSSYTIGGFEFSILYTYRKVKNRFRDIPCPVSF